MKKFKYLINNEEVSRADFKKELSLIYAKIEKCGCFNISIADYEKAENKIRAMQRNKVILVTDNKNYRVVRIG